MTQQAVSAAETSTFGHFSNIWDVAHHTSRVLAKNDQNCGLCVSTSGSVAEINAEMLSLRVGGSYLGGARPFDTIFEEISCDLAIVGWDSSSIVSYGKK